MAPSVESPRELTARSIFLGALVALVFAASSAWIALEAGIALSVSIPIAALSVTMVRAVSRVVGVPQSALIENTLVQAMGTAGESVASGIAFTLPALLLLGQELPWITVTTIGLVGGVLGVLLFGPMRRVRVGDVSLRHADGASAKVLPADDQPRVPASVLLAGFGLGAAYKFVIAGLHVFLEVPGRAPGALAIRGQSQLFGGLGADVSPELAGVGYLIGARISAQLLAGGVLASLLIVPAISLFDAGFALPAMNAPTGQAYFIGAGALASAGMFSLARRITGRVAASVDPVSGLPVAAMALAALVLAAAGWVGLEYRALGLAIAGVVCVAVWTAGAASRSHNTGHFVGAAPRTQQAGLLMGVAVSAVMVGGMLQLLNGAMTTIVPKSFPAVHVSVIDADRHYLLANGRLVEGGGPYRVGRLYEQTDNASAGKYLVDDVGNVVYRIDPGIGGRERTNYDGRVMRKLASPSATLIALVVDRIGTRTLPWRLIVIGVVLAAAIELLGMSAFPTAVGVYLPVPVSAALLMGGLIRWLAESRSMPEESGSADAGPGSGVLFSSGLIAGGAITGIVLAGLATRHFDEALDLSRTVGSLGSSNVVSMIGYVVLLAVPLYLVARRPRSTGS